MSATGLVFPQYLNTASMIATPILLGEVAFVLWLLIVGVRVPPSSRATAD